MLPPDFLPIETSVKAIKRGHFTTGSVVNGNKVMIELILNCDGKWSFTCAGKNIDLVKIGLPEKFQINKKSVDSLIEIVRQIRYCKGVEHNNADLPYFKTASFFIR